jgi:anti-sigma B factor antagonist
MVADGLQKLEIEIVVDDDRAVISVAGELDSTSAPRLISTVHDVAAPPIRRIDLDCGRVWFLDSAGVRALIVARNEATGLGIDLALVERSETVSRILDMTGLTGTLSRSSPN